MSSRIPVFRFTACCHPRAKDSSYNGLFLKTDEMQNAVSELAKVPVLWEHDESGKKVGIVEKAWVNEKNQIMTTICIPINNFRNAEIAQKIQAGIVTGLSLGMNHKIRSDTLEVLSKGIHEVSIVEEPDMPESYIHSIDKEDEDLAKTREMLLQTISNIRDTIDKSHDQDKKESKQEQQETVEDPMDVSSATNTNQVQVPEPVVPQQQQKPVEVKPVPIPSIPEAVSNPLSNNVPLGNTSKPSLAPAATAGNSTILLDLPFFCVFFHYIFFNLIVILNVYLAQL
jgi:phage head maturation protease